MLFYLLGDLKIYMFWQQMLYFISLGPRETLNYPFESRAEKNLETIHLCCRTANVLQAKFFISVKYSYFWVNLTLCKVVKLAREKRRIFTAWYCFLYFFYCLFCLSKGSKFFQHYTQRWTHTRKTTPTHYGFQGHRSKKCFHLTELNAVIMSWHACTSTPSCWNCARR